MITDNRSALFAWCALVALTLGSWWLGLEEQTGDPRYLAWFASGLLLLAGFKIRLIGLYFMELRHAPWPLRLAFECWVVGLCLAVLGFYHWAPGVSAAP
jgi:hypothetical protein